MKGIVERHGGTVEKFIGDAVIAVFGVPVAHEDDALRAVRAAAEMREALPELGLQARIGVNTGQVVTGTEERLATGDPVNVAARLDLIVPAVAQLPAEECFSFPPPLDPRRRLRGLAQSDKSIAPRALRRLARTEKRRLVERDEIVPIVTPALSTRRRGSRSAVGKAVTGGRTSGDRKRSVDGGGMQVADLLAPASS
jgi:hypothetical protein